MKVEARGAVFALLDDCDATEAARTSRLYTGFVREHLCSDAASLDAVCGAATADAGSGLHAVLLGDYEFGRDLHLKAATQRGPGTLRFLMFERCERLSRSEVDAWLAAADNGNEAPSVAGAANVAASVTHDSFTRAIEAVHEALRAGDSYQINYTYRLGFDAFGSPVALYRRLRARQPVRYGALICLPGDAWVVSCSPELFVEKSGTRLRTRPMKGTTARVPNDAQADARAAEFLHNDPKNRAENLMIVDLLRNDMSRVARTGSVSVPALFSVEPYPSIWAMTSTIEADLREDVTFADLLRALFPCGSITGAPKHRTMQLIDEIETTPRGLYTGTIGWLDASPQGDAARCGDFCLSVTIRTVTLDAPLASNGTRRATMGVGGGIVLDSVADDEYAECRLKAKFLTAADPGFALFETMYASRESGVRNAPRHLARLKASAATLGFTLDEAALRARIDAHCAALPAGIAHRVRVALSKDGVIEITGGPLGAVKPLSAAGAGAATADEAPIVGVVLAPECGFAPTRADDFLLRHKTTARAEYDRGWHEAEARGAFDMLFINERGELTEGGRSNVFVKLDGQWWTPPLSAGLLPGVMRQCLLDDPQMAAGERTLSLDDLLRAESIVVCNALRGMLSARVISAEPGLTADC